MVSHLTGWKEIMAGQLYRVVFEGEILEGSQVQEGKRAMQYVKAFERAGAVCRVEELEPRAGLEQPLTLEKETEKPSQQGDGMVCPKCQFEQSPSEECVRCGIIISKYSERFDAPESERRKEDIGIKPEQRSFKFLTIIVALLVVVLASGF